MKIKRIAKISGTDAFDSFEWRGQDLKRYNLVYGWNGSGKTTIARLLSFLERRNIHIPEFRAVEFTLQTAGGTVKRTHLSSHSLTIRVFNKDFIKENLGFGESRAKKIIILGKERVEAKKKIDELIAEHAKKERAIAELEARKAKAVRPETILREAASRVPLFFANTPLANHVYYGRRSGRQPGHDISFSHCWVAEKAPAGRWSIVGVLSQFRILQPDA